MKKYFESYDAENDSLIYHKIRTNTEQLNCLIGSDKIIFSALVYLISYLSLCLPMVC